MADDRSTTRPPLRLVGAGPGDAPLPLGEPASHVCTWCALRFPSRPALERHHAASPECRANQTVSSPLQTRYGDADMVWTQPGEHTLNRVRAKSCRHVHPRARLVDAAGGTIGYQCGWCYTVLRDDLQG